MKCEFQACAEPWSVYKLDDATEIRVKNVLVSVRRREGEYQQDGKPIYDIQAQNIIHIDCPDHLTLSPNVNDAGRA